MQLAAKAAGAVVVADQVTKAWGHTTASNLTEPVTNPDLALGLVSGSWSSLIASMVVALFMFGAHLRVRVNRGALSPVAAGLLIGGAVGNLADRLLIGVVRDFIPTPWLVFNIADVALLVGCCWYATTAFQSRPGPLGWS